MGIIFNVKTFTPSGISSSTKIINSCISPDKSKIAIATNSQGVKVFDYNDESLIQDVVSFNDVDDIQWTFDNNKLILTRDGRVYSYDATNSYSELFSSSSNYFKILPSSINPDEIILSPVSPVGGGYRIKKLDASDGSLIKQTSLSNRYRTVEGLEWFDEENGYIIMSSTSSFSSERATRILDFENDVVIKDDDGGNIRSRTVAVTSNKYFRIKNNGDLHQYDVDSFDFDGVIETLDTYNVANSMSVCKDFLLISNIRDNNPNDILVYDRDGNFVESIGDDENYEKINTTFDLDVTTVNGQNRQVTILELNNYKIKGKVLDSGSGVANVKVGCINQDTNELVGFQTTNSQGEYEFDINIDNRNDKHHIFLQGSDYDEEESKPFIEPEVEE